MKTTRLKRVLDRFDDLLERSDELDQELQEQLDRIRKEIRTYMDKSEEKMKNNSTGLAEKIQKVVDDFEISHPELMATLGEMIDSLSRMGF